jgi:hypothetical protein
VAARAGLTHEGGAPGDLLGDYLQRVRGALASGTVAALRTKLSGYEALAWDAALQNRAAADAARPGSVGAAYAAFAPTPVDRVREPGFSDAMPYYFRHTSRFEREHVRALMRLRCCSDPFAARPHAALWRPRRLRSVHRRPP